MVLALVVLGGFGLLRARPRGRGTCSPSRGARKCARRLGQSRSVLPGARPFRPWRVLWLAVSSRPANIGGLPLVDAAAGDADFAGAGRSSWRLSTAMVMAAASRARSGAGKPAASIDTVGWAAVLPQMLASLGAVFASPDVGKVRWGNGRRRWIPLDSRLLRGAVPIPRHGAVHDDHGQWRSPRFPVMTAAIGLPLIVHKFGGDPAIMGSQSACCPASAAR
jgi:hypothetical protein